MPVYDDVVMKDVEIRIRNFRGEERQFNPKGKRNFLVLLNDDVAAAMKADGWNVKELKPKEEGDTPTPFLKVNVNYDNEPYPKIYLVTSRGKTMLDSDTVNELDFAEIVKVDLVVSPYNYNIRGEEGITAYLSKGYFTIKEDELDLMYADTPISASGTSRTLGVEEFTPDFD